ncbi:hypothetical protein WA158_003996 [Blastocystis sp. Blastoise]
MNFFYEAVLVLFLVLQNTSLTMIYRYSRLIGEQNYATSTAVVMTEVFKIIVAFTVYMDLWTSLKTKDSLILMIIPSMFYSLQNNLSYFAASNLSPFVFSVLSQSKLFFTVLCSVIFLKKHVSRVQWMSLLILLMGVVSVDYDNNHSKQSIQGDHPLLASLAVLLSAFSSGLCSVLMEYIYKHTSTTPSTPVTPSSSSSMPSSFLYTLYTFSMQTLALSIGGLVYSLLIAYMTHGTQIIANGFFYGYNKYAIICIVLSGVGGICVGMMLKYLNSIYKTVSVSISLIVSCVHILIYIYINNNKYFSIIVL